MASSTFFGRPKIEYARPFCVSGLATCTPLRTACPGAMLLHMPHNFPKQCAEHGCTRLTLSARCAQHTREHAARSAARRKPRVRGAYGRHHQAVRLIVLERDRICTECRRRPSTVMHHEIPVVAGGKTDLRNCRGVCAPCNTRIANAREGGFGRPKRLRAD